MVKRNPDNPEDRKPPRKKTLADRVTIIRKRYIREAERFEKQAARTDSKTIASKLKAAAAVSREEAKIWQLRSMRKMYKGAALLKKIMLGEKSSQEAKATAGTAARRDRLAKNILKGQAGAAFYAGTIDLWRDVDYEQRDQAIMDALGVDSLWDAIEMVEKGAGVDLIDVREDWERYKDVSADVAIYIATMGA